MMKGWGGYFPSRSRAGVRGVRAVLSLDLDRALTSFPVEEAGTNPVSKRAQMMGLKSSLSAITYRSAMIGKDHTAREKAQSLVVLIYEVGIAEELSKRENEVLSFKQTRRGVSEGGAYLWFRCPSLLPTLKRGWQ